MALTRATGRFSFTVDSALFRELGERLVGRPQIAVAELVKNAYDADATHVVIAASPDGLQIRDNGSGMDKGAFESYWMRIGSPHKQRQDRSPRLKRPLTGSKGIGRLSAQFLGSKIEVRTVAARDPATELCARVDWDLAVKAGDVTQATADFFESAPETTFPDGSVHGTVVTIHDLNQVWTVDLFENSRAAYLDASVPLASGCIRRINRLPSRPGNTGSKRPPGFRPTDGGGPRSLERARSRSSSS